MFYTIKGIVFSHIFRNKVKYSFLALSFILGAGIGALLVGAMTGTQSHELSQYIDTFCRQITDSHISGMDILSESLLSNIRLLILLWVCSCFYLLIPIPFVIVAVRGFGVGFSLGFLTYTYGAKGLVLLLVSIVPQAIFSFPVLLFLSVIAVNYAHDSHKRKQGRSTSRMDNKFETRRRVYYFLLSCVVLIAASLVDAFISPVFVKSVCGLFLV